LATRDPTISIRPAAPADFARITAIYAEHVLHGTATFEIEPPGREEMMRRHAAVLDRGLPWLVATADDRVVGYGYADIYRVRPAYRYTVEDSIYLEPAWCGKGIGRRLLESVITQSEKAGFRQMIAVIGDSANTASIAVHRAAGFVHTGVLENVGFKFGRWIDTVIMQRPLGSGAATSPAPIVSPPHPS